MQRVCNTNAKFTCIFKCWRRRLADLCSQWGFSRFDYIGENMISEAFSFLLCVYVLLHIHISYLYLCLHSYNLISGFYTCTTWNLYLYGKMIYFTLHLHSLIFITFAKHDFWDFFILAVCVLCYIYIFHTYMSKLSRDLVQSAWHYFYMKASIARFSYLH